jgi:hypothetical protein
VGVKCLRVVRSGVGNAETIRSCSEFLGIVQSGFDDSRTTAGWEPIKLNRRTVSREELGRKWRFE